MPINMNSAKSAFGTIWNSVKNGSAWKQTKGFAKQAGSAFDRAAWSHVRDEVRGSGMVKAFFKKTDPHIGNAWLGIKARGVTNAAAFGLIAGGGTVLGAIQGSVSNSGAGAAKNVQYMGNIPGLDYDAVANGDNTGSKNLGATGQLVFGMHASRKGR